MWELINAQHNSTWKGKAARMTTDWVFSKCALLVGVVRYHLLLYTAVVETLEPCTL